MKIIVIGGTGTIGRPTVEALAEHDVVTAGPDAADIWVDLRDSATLKAMYQEAGTVDAVINLGGEVPFGTIEQVTDEDVDDVIGLVRGAIDLVRLGIPHVNHGGSFVLTSGSTVLNPIPITAISAAWGAAINGFVRSAALSLPRDLRINCVIPTLVAETARAEGIDGDWLPAAEVAKWYVEALTCEKTGQWRTVDGWTEFVSGGLGWDADVFHTRKRSG